jgi:cation:H+ antiporter
MDYVYLAAGFVLLLVGGDFLVRASIEISLRLKISVLVVGMTVVSFATSAPELLVSLEAALNGYSDISFGNVVGSNIANISLILGLTAIVFPIAVKEVTYKIDWWVMMAISVLFYALVYLGKGLVFWEACLMVLFLILYNILQIRKSRKTTKATPDEIDPQKKRIALWAALSFLGGGVLALKYGSDFLVAGSISIAQDWGVSERVIGLTIVSIGTSLPELAASMVASFKGEQELSLGNLLGSNIFNILAVLGFTGLFIDIPVQSEALLTYDIPVLLGISLLLYPFMVWITKSKISRLEGGILLGVYTIYVAFLF